MKKEVNYAKNAHRCLKASQILAMISGLFMVSVCPLSFMLGGSGLGIASVIVAFCIPVSSISLYKIAENFKEKYEKQQSKETFEINNQLESEHEENNLYEPAKNIEYFKQQNFHNSNSLKIKNYFLNKTNKYNAFSLKNKDEEELER